MMEMQRMVEELVERQAAMDRRVGNEEAVSRPALVRNSIYMVVDMLVKVVRRLVELEDERTLPNGGDQAFSYLATRIRRLEERADGHFPIEPVHRQDLLGQRVEEKRNHEPALYGIAAGDIVVERSTGERFRVVPLDALIDQPEIDRIEDVNANLHLGNGQAITWNGPAVKGDDGVWRIELCAPPTQEANNPA